MTKTQQIKHLINATKLLCLSGVCPQAPRLFHYWWDRVKFAHKKGYLYLGFSGSKVDMVAIGYRVESIPSPIGEVLPEHECGNILYVSVAASISKNPLKLFKLLKYYEVVNDVDTIAYHWRGNNTDLRIHKLRKNHVKL